MNPQVEVPAECSVQAPCLIRKRTPKPDFVNPTPNPMTKFQVRPVVDLEGEEKFKPGTGRRIRPSSTIRPLVIGCAAGPWSRCFVIPLELKGEERVTARPFRARHDADGLLAGSWTFWLKTRSGDDLARKNFRNDDGSCHGFSSRDRRPRNADQTRLKGRRPVRRYLC